MAGIEKVIFMNMCMVYDKEGNVVALDKVGKNYSGTTFPGGHVEPGETFKESVIREIYEETGLTIQNPRLTGVKALVASTLSIKPIMAGDKGNIVQRGQSIGMKKALRRMAEIILEEVGDAQHRTLMITHCNAPDRAETIKKLLTDKVQFRDCLIMDTRGVSSMYANDGGIIVTV